MADKAKSEKEIFDAYEKIRKEGCYNMVLNATGAMNAAGLDRKDYFNVLENYNSMSSKYAIGTN